MNQNILNRIKKIRAATPIINLITVEFTDGSRKAMTLHKLFILALRENADMPKIKAIYYSKEQEASVRLAKSIIKLDADSEGMPYLVKVRE